MCHADQERGISERIRHPEYNDYTFRHDLALLRLDTPVNTSVYVPTCLPDPNTDYTGSGVWVLGWGRTHEGGAVSDTLQELNMTVVKDEDCYEAMNGDTFPGEQLCAGGEKGKDGCQVCGRKWDLMRDWRVYERLRGRIAFTLNSLFNF